MNVARVVLGAVGVGLGLVGGWMLLDDGGEALRSVALFLVGGVLVHDALLAPLTILLGFAAFRLTPDRAHGAVLVGFTVWATTTVVALPALSGQGVKADNPTLLPRDYLAGWLGFSVVVVVATVAAAVWASRRAGAPPSRGHAG